MEDTASYLAAATSCSRLDSACDGACDAPDQFGYPSFNIGASGEDTSRSFVPRGGLLCLPLLLSRCWIGISGCLDMGDLLLV